MAIQVWIENGRSITLKELIEIVPKSKAAKELDALEKENETLKSVNNNLNQQIAYWTQQYAMLQESHRELSKD